MDTVRGAVHAVDLRARTIEITTGVGMALRVLRLQLPSETRFSENGAALAPALLRPGDIVRVTWGRGPTGAVAYTIERMGRLGAIPAAEHAP